MNIFGRHRVDAGKRVGVCDCPVCQPQSIRHLSVRARVSHAHVIPHARVHSGRAPLFTLFAFFCRRRSVEKRRRGPRETMPILSVESQEANDRGVPEKLIASWPRHWTSEMSSHSQTTFSGRRARKTGENRTKEGQGQTLTDY